MARGLNFFTAYLLLAAASPFAMSSKCFEYAGITGQFQRMDPGQVKPPCATTDCVPGTSVIVEFYPQISGFCQARFNHMKYYRKTRSVNTYNCLAGLFYYTCTTGPEDLEFCGYQTVEPPCPSGSCDPYNPGSPG
jgi:hypothetical protein